MISYECSRKLNKLKKGERTVAINQAKLRGRIIEKFGSQKAFAKAYGISDNSMSKKMQGKTAISLADIEKMSGPSFLDIKDEEIPVYFFINKVQ